MTYKQKYRSLTAWKKKILVMILFHHHMKNKRKGKWSQQNTARYFSVSESLVSENIKLYKFYDDLSKFKTRDSAIRFYR
jgi:hypothetical protein